MKHHLAKFAFLIGSGLFATSLLADVGTTHVREGTEIALTGTQLAEISDWAKNSKIDLEELLELTRNLDVQNSKERLKKGIEGVVAVSSPKTTELLMRYALNRALAINGDRITIFSRYILQ
jgi:hypothetical protein